MPTFKITIGLFLLFVWNAAYGDSQNIGFAYLDFGAVEGQMDPLDEIVDLNKDCDSNPEVKDVKKIVELMLLDIKKKSDPAFKSSYQILTELGYSFSAAPEFVNQHLLVPAYSNNNSTVKFILLPEAHSYALPSHLAGKNGAMEYKRTSMAISWIESNPSFVFLNLKEGIEGLDLPLVDGFTPSGDAFTEAYNLLGQSPFVTMVNIYQKSQNFHSSNLESPFYLLFDALVMSGFKQGMTYKEAVGLLEKNGFSVKDSFLPLVKDTWRTLNSWANKKYSSSAKRICEYRSHQMAERALQKAKERKASIVFLTFGAAHSKGIMAYLDQQKISYALVLGTAKPLK